MMGGGAAEIAIDDEKTQERRELLCDAAAVAFSECGKVLWVGGFLIGRDRVEGTSPFRYGSDATVGISTVTQIGGELVRGALVLLRQGNTYGASALLRQLVEVQYLAWAFAENDVGAERWLRSTPEERAQTWQPRQLRKTSRGRFPTRDYQAHCELGGHPTPEATRLLPDHSDRIPSAFLWVELAAHCTGIWSHVTAAGKRLGWASVIGGLPSALAFSRAIQVWGHDDDIVRNALHRLVPPP